MNLINIENAGFKSELMKAHYDFPRASRLQDALSWALADYYSKMTLGDPFEARGLLVTGPSRIGKSTEIRKLLHIANDGSTLMPDGRPAKIVSVMLSGALSWKDLGMHTLNNGLRYPAKGRLTQRQIWDRVFLQAKLQGVVGIHFDECQHIFPHSKEGRTKILDSFKSLLKHSEWPLILILSGVDELAKQVVREEQLAYLLKPISLPEIAPSNSEDLHELHSLCHAYVSKAGMEFGDLPSRDFYERLAAACAFRWGLVVELLIDVLVLAKSENANVLNGSLFCRAFTSKLGLTAGFSPFSIEEYQLLFEPKKLFDLWGEHNQV